MKNVYKLTERQWNKYWKNIGISFYILVATMIPNAFIKEWCNIKWANPIMETTILLVIPFLYAAISNLPIRPQSSLKFNIIVCILISLVIAILLWFGIYYNAFKIIDNNMISDSIWGLIPLFGWDICYIVNILRILINGRNH